MEVSGVPWQDFAAAWGAGLATVVAIVQGVSIWLARRPSVDTTYSLLGHPDMSDTITIANLSPTPLMVAYWRLKWVPTWWRWWIGQVEQTPARDPDDHADFNIPGYETYILSFSDEDKLQWNYDVAKGRKLVLILSVFGKKRPIKVKVK